MVLNYIGSKRTLAPRIINEITKEWPDLNSWCFLDPFAGTGALSSAISDKVKSLQVNDWEDYSYFILKAVFNPPIDRLPIIEELDKTPPSTGIITTTYTEQGGRLFFTPINGQRIDGIREALRNPKYSHDQRNYGIASLISSADSVANVASVYGAYLKQVKTSATNTLRLHLIPPAAKPATVYQMDGNNLCVNPDLIDPRTLIYLDPPYNQRQYGANYFPLNVIADISANQINVSGKTGIPTEGYKKSAWCSKRSVKETLKEILQKTPARRIALSYNREGLMTHADIANLFTGTDWNYKRIEIPYKRFASQKDLEPDVVEYLFLAERK